MRKGGMRLIDPLGMGVEYQVMGITSTPEGEEVYPFPALQLSPGKGMDVRGS
jgi:hypothetical protein